MDTKYLDLHRTCRICLSTENDDPSNGLLDVNDPIESSNEHFTSYELLNELHLLEISAIDPIEECPQKICEKCFNFLVEIKKFHEICKASAVTVKEYINKSRSKAPMEIEFNNIKIESVFVEQLDEVDMKLDLVKDEFDEFDNVEIGEKIESMDASHNSNESNEPSEESRNEDSDYSNSDNEMEILNGIVVKDEDFTEYYFITCKTCNRRFRKHSTFHKHKSEFSCKAFAQYVCQYCKDALDSCEAINMHLLEQHPSDQPHYCKLCKINFNVKPALRNHMRNEHKNEFIYKCDLCENGFQFKEDLGSHRRTVHTEKRHECPQCKRLFKNPYKFRVHLKRHDPTEKKFECNFCDKKFVKQYELVSHMERHNTSVRETKCNKCGKYYRNDKALKLHMRIHENNRPFQCECCGKNYITRSALDIHMRVHAEYEGYKYICNVCNRKFKILSSLTTHEKTHNEVRKHPCDQCKCSFKYAHHLRNHINGVHLKLKPHSCTMCDKKFCRSSTLEVHMRIHTGEKPYECSYCKKGFPGTQTLRHHMRVHTGEMPYKCELCSTNFMNYRQLAHHTFIQHDREKSEATQSTAEPRNAT